MEVIVTAQFARDVRKELSKQFQEQLADIIMQMENAANLQEIPGIKKLKGYKTAYRIKMDAYRIGFVLDGNKAIMSRVMHRKEIYRYFP